MKLKAKVHEDMTAAMRGGADERLRLAVLRLLLSEIHNAEIAKGAELEDDDVLAVIAREAKRRREAVGEFERGGRQDLVAKETAEAEILDAYLPAQMGDDQLAALVDEAILATGAASKGEIGKVMGWLMPRIKGKADGALANRLVSDRLGE